MSDFLTVTEVAQRYATSTHSVYRWVRDGRNFPAPYEMPSGIKRWKLSELQAWEETGGALNPVDMHAPMDWSVLPEGFDGGGHPIIQSGPIISRYELIRQWAADRNLIKGATSQAQTVKLFEEGGEVAAAVAKGNLDALKDGIGDMAVVLVILAAQNGLTFEECVAAAYDEIKDRKGRMVDGIFIRDL